MHAGLFVAELLQLVVSQTDELRHRIASMFFKHEVVTP
jgi:hypothetical protein